MIGEFGEISFSQRVTAVSKFGKIGVIGEFGVLQLFRLFRRVTAISVCSARLVSFGYTSGFVVLASLANYSKFGESQTFKEHF